MAQTLIGLIFLGLSIFFCIIAVRMLIASWEIDAEISDLSYLIYHVKYQTRIMRVHAEGPWWLTLATSETATLEEVDAAFARRIEEGAIGKGRLHRARKEAHHAIAAAHRRALHQAKRRRPRPLISHQVVIRSLKER